MVMYYCNCLNVSVLFGEEFDRLDDYYLSDEEKRNDFFQQLPLIIVQRCKISEQHTALIQLTMVGSWIVHKCIHCSICTHATKCDESTTVVFLNASLKKLTDQETELMEKSSEFSPVFQILVSNLLPHFEYDSSSQLSDDTSTAIIELKRFLTEKLEEQKKVTENIIKKFILEQENILKNYVKRANEDYQSIKTAMFSYVDKGSELAMSGWNNQQSNFNSVINNLTSSENPNKSEEKIEEGTTSLDCEGLFLLDEMSRNNASGDENHSEEDRSDTDDSGNRDEGIYIPRKRSVAVVRSLPIRVQANFNPCLRLIEDRLDDDNKRKPKYKRKMRNEKPIDIAASMKALADSVHGDYIIFGDLPPPRIGSRI